MKDHQQKTSKQDKKVTLEEGQIEQVAENNETLDTLNALEPSSGIEVDVANALNAIDTLLNGFSVTAQPDSVTRADPIRARGILDQTELQYDITSLVAPSFQSTFLNRFDQFNLLTGARLQETDIRNDIEEIAVEQIRLSNQTTDQVFINNDSHYEIDQDATGMRAKLDSVDLNISGVSSSALVHYRFKTDSDFRAVLKSNWNSVKNIDVQSEDLNTIFLKNFVHTDVSLTGDADKTIRIIDAKRGFIETEDGSDKITVKALTNGSGWSNTFDIDSGAGHDHVTVIGHSGNTIAKIKAGSGDDVVRINGDYAYSYTDLGAGADQFKNGKGEDTVIGGAGNDVIRTGAQSDVLYGGQDNDLLFGGRDVDVAVFRGSVDEYIITKRGGTYTIEDTVTDRDGIDMLRGVEGLLFGGDDLVTGLLTSLTSSQIETDFGLDTANDFDFADVLDDYTPIQDAIDDFVQNGAVQSVSQDVQAIGAEFSIFTLADALIHSNQDIV